MKFSTIRFGNVLGTSGSVVPLFKKQIELGGPITITDPAMERYFLPMSVAISLILQISKIASKDNVYVLNMGKPIRILELAKRMIQLSGYHENDIEINFSGLRPGELLQEQITLGFELVDSDIPGVLIEKVEITIPSFFEQKLESLKSMCLVNNSAESKKILFDLIR